MTTIGQLTEYQYNGERCFTGHINTLDINVQIRLVPTGNTNPDAPTYEVVALGKQQESKIGAAWLKRPNKPDSKISEFLSLTIDDPSFPPTLSMSPLSQKQEISGRFRGVVVKQRNFFVWVGFCNTHPYNYMEYQMKKIYQNFDGLEVSFQCAIPQYILDQLETARLDAQKHRHDAPIRIGINQILVSVAETGARGGYRYRFDTGIDGATWFVVPSCDTKNWNVRVSCKSLMLALYGYYGTKERILNTLINDLDAIFPIRGIFSNCERVSRFDYCFDFISDEFLPDAECFVALGRTKKDYIQRVSALGRRIETITVGKMPNRQIVIYDKIREITVRGKNYWWDIWGIKKDEIKGRIWRIEIRAGKKELNQWNCRKFADLEKMAGDIIIEALNTYRYVARSENDTNVTRWETAKFWENCTNYAKNYLAEFISNAKRENIIRDYRVNLMERYEKCFLGLATSYAAILGLDKSQIPTVLDIITSDVARRIDENPQKFAAKFAKKENKFEILEINSELS